MDDSFDGKMSWRRMLALLDAVYGRGGQKDGRMLGMMSALLIDLVRLTSLDVRCHEGTWQRCAMP